MRRISMLSGLAVLAALTFSQAAIAQASPTPQSVGSHVQQAINALQDFQAAVRSGDEAAARGALRRNRRQTAVAAHQAAALDGSVGASVTQRVAQLRARNLKSYVGAFPLAGADLQLDLTNLIGVAIDACSTAADAVAAAADYVPADARDRVLAAAQAIRDACASAFPDGPGTGGDISQQAIQACHDAIAQWNTLIDQLLAVVPANLPFASFLTGLTGTVTGLIHTLTAQADAACDMLGGIGTGTGTGLMGIFGSWLGGTGLGTGDLSGILSGLFGNGGTGGFNLFGNLLGGLFGGGGTAH